MLGDLIAKDLWERDIVAVYLRTRLTVSIFKLLQAGKGKLPHWGKLNFIKIGTRNVHLATAVYNYRFYFESLGVKHFEIPTCCSREEPSD